MIKLRSVLMGLSLVLFIFSAADAQPKNGKVDNRLDSLLTAASVAFDLESPTLQSLAEKIDTNKQGFPIVVFNGLMWNRTDYVKVASPFDSNTTKAVVATDGSKEFPAQIVGDRVVFTARNVPALGYKVFWLKAAEKGVSSAVTGAGNSIENEFFRITLDPDAGAIVSIYDKHQKREIVPKNQLAGVLKLVSQNAETKRVTANIMQQAKGSVMIEIGPARAMVRSDYDCAASSFVQDVMVYDKIARIDVKVTADWRESGANSELSVCFPTVFNHPKVNFEQPIPGLPQSAKSWGDVSTDNFGLSILNNGSLSPIAENGLLRQPLLSGVQPSSIYELSYALYPHAGSWLTSLMSKTSQEVHSPLYAVDAKKHEGSLPSSKSLLSLSPSNLKVLFLRRSLDRKDLILTFAETDGVSSKVVLQTTLPIKTYVQTDKRGRNLGEAQPAGKRIQFGVKKHEIVTLRLGLS